MLASCKLDTSPAMQSWASFQHVLGVIGLVQGLIGLVNRPRTTKLWAIAHENGHKYKNVEFWDMPLKHVVSVMGLVNHLGNPKQWAKTALKRKTTSFWSCLSNMF
jgi:hypothetical protein